MACTEEAYPCRTDRLVVSGDLRVARLGVLGLYTHVYKDVYKVMNIL